MTTDDRTMLELAAWLADEAKVAVPPGLPQRVEAMVDGRRQRPAWLAAIASPAVSHRVTSSRDSLLWIAVGVLVVLAALSAALIGARLLHAPLRLQMPGGAVIEPGPVLGKARAGHAAIVLDDGRVAVISGDGQASIEVLDPLARTWTVDGEISEARHGLSVARLADGTVLVTGGEANPSHMAHVTVDTAEVWDPATGRSALVGRMRAPRTGHLSFALPDGSVLVVGGDADRAGRSPALPEIYDARRRAFSTVAVDLPGPMTAAAQLPDARILLVGTGDPAAGAASGAWASIFDPASRRPTPTGRPLVALAGQTATALPDGRVVLIGGMLDDGQTPDATVQVFDPATGSFSVGAPLAMPRSGHIAVGTRDGRVIVIGGRTRSEKNLPVTTGSVEVIDPDLNATRVIGDLGVDRTSDATATLLADGTILLVGGRTGGHVMPITSTDLVHPTTP